MELVGAGVTLILVVRHDMNRSQRLARLRIPRRGGKRGLGDWDDAESKTSNLLEIHYDHTSRSWSTAGCSQGALERHTSSSQHASHKSPLAFHVIAATWHETGGGWHPAMMET